MAQNAGNPVVFLNGRLQPAAEAAVSIDDAGLQHGVGLFETLSARHGRAFRLQQHLERLAASAHALGLARQINVAPLAQAVDATLQANHLSEARIRVTITAGNVSLLRPLAHPEPAPAVLIVATPPTTYDPSLFQQGVMVLIAPPAANPFDQLAGHKTLAYWGRLRTLRQAAAAGAQEAIWLQVTNHLAGGAISNLFVVRDGRLLTPIARGEETPGGLAAPVLPGVTRAAILELAQQRAIPVERRMLSIADLLDADEAFLTNSSWQVLPVTRVERKPVADGAVGPVTRDLREAILDLIDRETQARPASASE